MIICRMKFTNALLAALLALAAVYCLFAPVQAAGNADYTVEPGDNLAMIAARYGLMLGQLIDANPQIHDPNLIYGGQVITLPVGRSEGPSGNPSKRLFAWQIELNGGRVEKTDHLYLVRGGDNYIRVARIYGITVDDFFAANPQIPYKTDLRKGELVHIPVDKLGEGVFLFYETP
jgi:hypothetical protein